MFEIITTDELLKRLDAFSHKELHVHHTWSPSKKDFNGSNGIALQNGMRNYHVNTLGWADIGQHVTLLPDGRFVTGRPFAQTPASITGYNTGGFAMEMLGNFDIGYDSFEGAQKASALRLAKYFIDKGRYVRFHRENSTKTCPGTGINKDTFISEAKGVIYTTVTAAPASTKVGYKTGVGILQRLCNDLGKSDENGNTLTDDGKTGTHTRAAVAKLPVCGLPYVQRQATCTIQTLLNSWGYKCGNIDGIFEKQVAAEVKLFQANNGLKADGLVGKNTWLKLLEVAAKV